MSGFLSLHADPVLDLHAATKRYVDNQDDLLVSKSGSIMTGDLVLNGAPSVDNQASTKKYVDDNIATRLPLSGGTLTGSLVLQVLLTLTSMPLIRATLIVQLLQVVLVQVHSLVSLLQQHLQLVISDSQSSSLEHPLLDLPQSQSILQVSVITLAMFTFWVTLKSRVQQLQSTQLPLRLMTLTSHLQAMQPLLLRQTVLV